MIVCDHLLAKKTYILVRVSNCEICFTKSYFFLLKINFPNLSVLFLFLFLFQLKRFINYKDRSPWGLVLYLEHIIFTCQIIKGGFICVLFTGCPENSQIAKRGPSKLNYVSTILQITCTFLSNVFSKICKK